MYSAARSSPREGVARPSRASDARKETSALRSLARTCAAMRSASGGWPCAASRPAAAREAKVASGKFRERTIPMIPLSPLLRQVDHAAAGLGAASAPHLSDVLVEAVVHRQLLAAADGALAHVEDVALEVHGAQVGIAAMVDDLGARAAERAVKRPVIVQREEVSHWSGTPPLGLAAADSLARVLDDFAPRRDRFLGVDPAPVDPGLADGESELGVPWIDRRCLDENASHVVFQIVAQGSTLCTVGQASGGLSIRAYKKIRSDP